MIYVTCLEVRKSVAYQDSSQIQGLTAETAETGID